MEKKVMYGLVEFSNPEEPIFMDFVFDDLNSAKEFAKVLSNNATGFMYTLVAGCENLPKTLVGIELKVFKFEVLE